MTSLDEAMEIADGDADERNRAAPVLHTAVFSLRRVLAEIIGIADSQPGTLAAQAMTPEDKRAWFESRLRMIRSLADRTLGEPLSEERHSLFAQWEIETLQRLADEAAASDGAAYLAAGMQRAAAYLRWMRENPPRPGAGNVVLTIDFDPDLQTR